MRNYRKPPTPGVAFSGTHYLLRPEERLSRSGMYHPLPFCVSCHPRITIENVVRSAIAAKGPGKRPTTF